MKILVTYFSQTGNTEMIAKAIHEEVLAQGHECVQEAIRESSVDDLNQYDLIFLGAACHDSDLAKPAIKLLDEIESDSPFKLAGFATHSTNLPEGNERNKELYERWAWKIKDSFKKVELEKEIDLFGYFGCMGKPNPGIEIFIHREIITDVEEWEEYIEGARKHPDEDDLANARVFAREMLAKLV